jgi:hypothetical protein
MDETTSVLRAGRPSGFWSSCTRVPGRDRDDREGRVPALRAGYCRRGSWSGRWCGYRTCRPADSGWSCGAGDAGWPAVRRPVRGLRSPKSAARSPARARVTTRLRQRLAEAIAGSNRTVAEVAAEHGVPWHTAHEALVAAAARWLTLRRPRSGRSKGPPCPCCCLQTMPRPGRTPRWVHRKAGKGRGWRCIPWCRLAAVPPRGPRRRWRAADRQVRTHHRSPRSGLLPGDVVYDQWSRRALGQDPVSLRSE